MADVKELMPVTDEDWSQLLENEGMPESMDNGSEVPVGDTDDVLRQDADAASEADYREDIELAEEWDRQRGREL